MMLRFNKGFTLIELIITLTIAGIVMALVGPLTVSQVGKMEARSEISSLKTDMMNWSFLAFAKGCPINIYLNNSKVLLSSPVCNYEKRKSYGYIGFPKQSIEISVSGYSSQTLIKYFWVEEPEESMSLALDASIINVTDETASQ